MFIAALFIVKTMGTATPVKLGGKPLKSLLSLGAALDISRPLRLVVYVIAFVVFSTIACIAIGGDMIRILRQPEDDVPSPPQTQGTAEWYWTDEIFEEEEATKSIWSEDGKPPLELVGDRCHLREGKLLAEAQKPHGTLRGEKRYWFNDTWQSATELYGAMEAGRRSMPAGALLCTIISIRGEVPCLRHECLLPLYIRPHFSDFSVVKQLFENREYGFIKNYRPATILDAGANVGYASVIFAQMFPTSTVVAVEASAANYEVMKLNTRHLANVVPLNAGLHDHLGDMVLVNGSEKTREGWQYVLKRRREVPPGTGVALKTVTIDFLLQLFGLRRFDFVKIDIEGSEREVFSESADREYRPATWLDATRLVAVETHDRVKPGCRAAVERALLAGGRFKSVRSGEYLVWHNVESIHNITLDGAGGAGRRPATGAPSGAAGAGVDHRLGLPGESGRPQHGGEAAAGGGGSDGRAGGGSRGGGGGDESARAKFSDVGGSESEEVRGMMGAAAPNVTSGNRQHLAGAETAGGAQPGEGASAAAAAAAAAAAEEEGSGTSIATRELEGRAGEPGGGAGGGTGGVGGDSGGQMTGSSSSSPSSLGSAEGKSRLRGSRRRR